MSASAENLKDGDRAFHSVEGSKIVKMIYYDQLIQRAARISQLLNISLSKYVTRKYSIVNKVHKSATCISKGFFKYFEFNPTSNSALTEI